MKLVRFYEGADGLKTGHTDAAKYCLAATAKKEDLRFIAIVLGEEDSKVRNQEVMSLLDYGFNHYQMNLIKSKDQVLKKIPVDKATKTEISLVPVHDIGVLSKKSDNSRKYTYDVEVNSFKFPVKEGDIVGKVVVKDKDKNKKITSVDLTVLEDIDSLSYIELFYKGFKDLFSGNYTFSFVQ